MNFHTVVFSTFILYFTTISAFRDPFQPPPPLYNASDPIVLLDVTNIQETILNSDKAWMVEFYSSWCGHCQNFAPTFKKLAQKVHGWRNVIAVGAIDCAQDENIPSCRDFGIMGYPTMKLIPPMATMEQVSSFQDLQAHKVDPIVKEMINFALTVKSNPVYVRETSNWPNLDPFKSTDVRELWDANAGDVPHAVVVLDSSETQPGVEILLSLSEVTMSMPKRLPVHRVIAEHADPTFLKKLGFAGNEGPQMVIIEKVTMEAVNLTPESKTNPDFVEALRKFLKRHNVQSNFDVNRIVAKPPGIDRVQEKVVIKSSSSTHNPKMVHSEEAIKRRRYTVFMADLERALLYSFAHEAAQHQMIAGDALNALHDYVDVLVKFFPFRHDRPSVKIFLGKLRQWILSHDDAIRGEDLAEKVKALQENTDAFNDLPSTWVGCQGSAPNYGGYPCGLWTLFHTLTVQQKKKATQHPKLVLRTMVEFIEHFFSCRECARHFSQANRKGQAVEQEVEGFDEAVLWLWKTHNKVNQRLSGDLTDDPEFPKEVFPNRQHCSDCYSDNAGGHDLWREFKKPNVLVFLDSLHESISLEGLSKFEPVDSSHKSSSDRHQDLLIIPKPRERLAFPLLGKETLDKRNFARESDQRPFFSSADIGLGSFIYLTSVAILILAYLRFVAKTKMSSCLTRLCPRGLRSTSYMNGSSNPLLGKV